VGHPYHEEALRYLLAVERKRAARAGRSLLIMLVSLEKRQGMSSRLDRATSDSLFRALSASVREVDVVGWYRQDRVIGAVLDQGAAVSADAATARIAERVRSQLEASSGAPLARSIRIKVIEVVPRKRDGVLDRAASHSGTWTA
jgi:hypothetical protein